MKFKLVENLNEDFNEDEIIAVGKALELYKENNNPKGFVPLTEISRNINNDNGKYSLIFRGMYAKDIYDIIKRYYKQNKAVFNKNNVKVRF